MVEVGGVYRHFKGGKYEVMCVAGGCDEGFLDGLNVVRECVVRDCDSSSELVEMARDEDGRFWLKGVESGEYVVYRQLYNSDFSCETAWFRKRGDFEGVEVFDDGRRVKRFELVEDGED